MCVPDQQRTLNNLPIELRCRNLVTEHRLHEHANRCQRCKKVYATCVFQLRFHFAYHPWWLGMCVDRVLGNCGTSNKTSLATRDQGKGGKLVGERIVDCGSVIWSDLSTPLSTNFGDIPPPPPPPKKSAKITHYFFLGGGGGEGRGKLS